MNAIFVGKEAEMVASYQGGLIGKILLIPMKKIVQQVGGTLLLPVILITLGL